MENHVIFIPHPGVPVNTPGKSFKLQKPGTADPDPPLPQEPVDGLGDAHLLPAKPVPKLSLGGPGLPKSVTESVVVRKRSRDLIFR